MAAGGLYFLSLKPSHHYNWTTDQKVLPEITFLGEQVSIKAIRNFEYESTSMYEPGFYDRTYDLNGLKGVWFIVEHLSSSWNGPAHTMLSFEFEGPEYLVISIEIRKKRGQEFSPFKGLFKQYELMYVIADERDALLVRTNHRKDPVYLYKAVASPEQVRQLFVDMLTRAEKLRMEPEFYNTLFNSCTTNIVKHIRKNFPGSVPRSYKVLIPGYSDRLAYDIGLLDRALPFEKLKELSLITPKALEVKSRDEFSEHVR